jgi:hypothetical protein
MTDEKIYTVTQDYEGNIMPNFSCYIAIKNESSINFEDGKSYKSWGRYDSRPKSEITPNDKTEFRLENKSLVSGSTGYVTYCTGKGMLRFDYDCPYSGKNVLSYHNNGAELEVLFYGENTANYLSAVPKNRNGEYPSKGHPLSGIYVVKDPLSAGWDIINATEKSVVNQKLKSLYNDNVLPHKFNEINIGCPEITGGDASKQGELTIKASLNGEVNEFIHVDGDCEFTVNLNAISSSIKKNNGTSYTLSIDFNGDILDGIDLSKVDVSVLYRKIPTDEIEKSILKLVNEAFQNIKPIELPFNLFLPLPLNNTTIKFSFVENNEASNKSFFAILVGLQGSEGLYRISTNVIDNASKNNSSVVLSNKLIMNYLKQILFQVLKDNELFVGNDFLELENGYPMVLTNQIDSKKFEFPCNVSIEIDRNGIKSLFENDSRLKVELDLKYTEVLIGVSHTYHIKLYISFTQSKGNLKLNFSSEIDSCSGGTTCHYIKKGVEKALSEFEKLFLEGLQITIPNFYVNQVSTPSYIQISGKLGEIKN